jgi:hypothetical protein
MAFGQRVRELGGREAEGDDEGQIEEQFQRRGGAVRLVPVTATHRPGVMVPGGGARRFPGAMRHAAD